MTAVNRYFKPAEHDATFRLGLDILLDRLEAVAAADEGTGGRGTAPPAESRSAGRQTRRAASEIIT